MNQLLIVRGRYVGRTFIPDGPLPDAEGPAELVITPSPPQARGSIADRRIVESYVGYCLVGRGAQGDRARSGRSAKPGHPLVD